MRSKSRWNRGWVVLAGGVVLTLTLLGADFRQQSCGGHLRLAAPPPPGGRQYAPDRTADILHLALDVTPDFARRTVAGTATLRFKPIAQPLEQLRLDAVNLSIDAVESEAGIRTYHVAARELIITFATPIPEDREAEVTIRYWTQPEQGLYFRTPELGYRAEDTHLFTQGEAIHARHWYPCFDEPNEKFTSEVTCRVPEGMTVLSNGRKLSEVKDTATGLVAVRWLQDKPHVNYLVTLVAGYFRKLEDRHGQIPLGFYTPPSDFLYAASSFRDTRDMMEYFEREIGVPYPWARYDQVVVHDFVAGGMENTTQTTLTHHTLFTDAFETIRSSQGLVAHELVHQWFGDLVTCKDWSHLWLNEGFATYYESLYEGHRHGQDALHYELYQRARHLTGLAEDTNAIVRRTYAEPDHMFDHLAYPKGGWVLHMLRSELGEDLYRRCIRTFLERHAYGVVVTEDLRRVIEELSGRSFDRFFDQWLYHAHHPELKVGYTWDDRSGMAHVTIRQVQALSPQVLLFEFPLKLRFHTPRGTVEREIRVREERADLQVPLAAAPTVVRVDPDYTLLAKIDLELPPAMFVAQLGLSADAVGRWLAIEQLAKREDAEAMALLRQALQSDAFFGVRIEAARALAGLRTPEAFEALKASLHQPDARVRLEVVNGLAAHYREGVAPLLEEILRQERNPDILAAAIRGLAGRPGPGFREVVIPFLKSDSFRQVLAHAALEAIRTQDDPACRGEVESLLKTRGAALTSDSLLTGLQVVARLARNDENRDPAREFLMGYLTHPRRQVAAAVLDALGTLGDPRALPVLERFAAARKGSPEQVAAERALPLVRGQRRPAEELDSLRSEVLQLQQAQRDLKQSFEELTRKMEGRETNLEGARESRSTKKPGRGK
jgi:aminopeptidase N